jgi:predicted metal-dependent enzyme (double-stranded beta helix superfamily)
MTPEMRRVVTEAEAAARNGWSDQAVKSLTEAARELRCDTEEVARLLALPVADHGFREEVFTTDPAFHASVFALAEGETIPLHDHPALNVISKVLCGRMRVQTYEWIDTASRRARDCGEVVLGPDDDALVLRNSPGTLHSVTALEPTAFLDLFAPYYDDAARPCTYYKVARVADDVLLRVVSWEEARR